MSGISVENTMEKYGKTVWKYHSFFVEKRWEKMGKLVETWGKEGG
jgi:hypothetical protein